MGKFRNFGNEQQRLNIEFKELYIEIKNFLITKGFDTSSEELINYLKKEFYIAIGNGFHQHE
ncbi:MAG TPA: hypothetical protein VLB02_00255, partial [Candidatus Paceibacterota bacterium]|nr:hypothetical protein [Candidatus Paceibacterota bacterium]